MSKREATWRRKDIMGGMLCMKGTRIPVKFVREYASIGYSSKRIKEECYPILSIEQIEAVIK